MVFGEVEVDDVFVGIRKRIGERRSTRSTARVFDAAEQGANQRGVAARVGYVQRLRNLLGADPAVLDEGGSCPDSSRSYGGHQWRAFSAHLQGRVGTGVE